MAGQTCSTDALATLTSFLVLFWCVEVARPFESPSFKQPITNTTVAVGREAILECLVENLNPYKVAWLRVDTQTILTIHNHVITKNHRIGVTHSEQKTWYLHIREVRESDKGWYMCQINTDPMKSQVGYLNVVVPPDILDYPTSADMVVDEGSDVSLRCVAKGSPEPSITWKREDGHLIHLQTGVDVSSTTGPILNLTNVKRDHMAPYLCIASNGVPPSVSKRIMLIVQFPPSVWIQYQLIGAYDAQQITLECHSEAFPKSINYWTRDKGEIIPHNAKYVPEIVETGFKVHMKLTINFLGPQDYGIYRCISKNSLGDMEGTINVYRIPNPNRIQTRDKSASKVNNGVTYPKEGREKDRADLLYLDNELYSSARLPFPGYSGPLRLLLVAVFLCALSKLNIFI
ncbi:unnamed protein product [Brassicogethes aeneus]|uniref:Ig-like domain-containing protein n=1 Tax=Brassicogethes aeneus TaxID=1431903 RepID=A0A9P0B0Z8_BRAAE|nr:unnamed protein product [Brassicogethes aeneus]